MRWSNPVLVGYTIFAILTVASVTNWYVHLPPSEWEWKRKVWTGFRIPNGTTTSELVRLYPSFEYSTGDRKTGFYIYYVGNGGKWHDHHENPGSYAVWVRNGVVVDSKYNPIQTTSEAIDLYTKPRTR